MYEGTGADCRLKILNRKLQIVNLQSSLQRPRSPNGDCSILMTRYRVPLHEELTCPTVFQRQAVTLAGREGRQVFRGLAFLARLRELQATRRV